MRCAVIYRSDLSKPCGGLLSEDAQLSLARYDITLPKDVLVDPQIFAVKTIWRPDWCGTISAPT